MIIYQVKVNSLDRTWVDVSPHAFNTASDDRRRAVWDSPSIPADPERERRLVEMLETLCNGLAWNIENHPDVMNETDAEALAEARAMLERYGVSHMGPGDDNSEGRV